MTQQTHSNPTVEAVINRLPSSEIISVTDISAALGVKTSSVVRTAIDLGLLNAVRVGRSHVIQRAEAVRWIRSLGSEAR